MSIDKRLVTIIIGFLFLAMAISMCLPFAIACAAGIRSEISAFLWPGLIFLVLGALMASRPLSKRKRLGTRDGIIIAVFGWLSVCIISAIPFYISGATGSLIDAFFEAVSCFTATGATIILRPESLPVSVLVWRAFLQWVGGLATLALLMAVTTISSSSSGFYIKTENESILLDSINPVKSKLTAFVYLFYTGMSILEVIALKIAGMSTLDAFLVTFSTASTGGLNNASAGLVGFTTPAMEIIIMIFMTAACLNFTLYYSAFRKNFERLRDNTELKAYIAILALGIILITADLLRNGVYDSFAQALRYGAFQAVSFSTTTGIANTDFSAWPTFSKALLTILSVIGGCSSSTGSALKALRVVLLAKLIWRSFFIKIHSRAVVTIRMDKKPVPTKTTNRVLYYTLGYILVFVFGAFLLSFEAPDMQTAFTAAISMLNNIGAGFGAMGSFANYAGFGSFSKAVLCALMLTGRLEIYSVVLIFTKEFWKN